MTTWYMDADDDGHGDAAVSVESCDPVDGHVDSVTTATMLSRHLSRRG